MPDHTPLICSHIQPVDQLRISHPRGTLDCQCFFCLVEIGRNELHAVCQKRVQPESFVFSLNVKPVVSTTILVIRSDGDVFSRIEVKIRHNNIAKVGICNNCVSVFTRTIGSHAITINEAPLTQCIGLK